MVAELEAKQLASICNGAESDEDSDEENYHHIYKAVDASKRLDIEQYKELAAKVKIPKRNMK